jgi:hypothetical protein
MQYFVQPWPLFQLLDHIVYMIKKLKKCILYTVGRTPWTGDQPVLRPTGQHKHRICTQTSMFRAGFEPMITVLDRAKAVYALEHCYRQKWLTLTEIQRITFI